VTIVTIECTVISLTLEEKERKEEGRKVEGKE
jgi:hypothetical protein